MMMLLSACGSKDKGGASSGSSTEGSAASAGEDYIYVGEFKQLPVGGESEYVSDAIVSEGKLYCSLVTYDDYASGAAVQIYDLENMSLVKSIPVEGAFAEFLAREDVAAAQNHGVSLNSLAVDNGKIYAVAYAYAYDQEGNDIGTENVLLTMDSDGNVLSTTDLAALNVSGNEYFYIGGMVGDGKGKLLLFSNNTLYLLTEGSQDFNTVDMGTDSYISRVIYDNEKFWVYYQSAGDNYENVLKEVNFDAASLGNKVEGLNGYFTGICKSDQPGVLLAIGSSNLYSINLADGTSQAILNWSDSNIMGDTVRSAEMLEDGRINVITYDWNTSKTEIATLTKTARSEVGTGGEIVINSLFADQTISAHVVAFNKAQNEYHATLNVFYDWEADENINIDDAITNLQNSLTGANPPDLVDLSNLEYYLSVKDLAGKGVLEDLTSYAEASSAVDLGSYTPAGLESYTVDGRLVALPKSLSVTTLAGSVKDLGDKPGWTIDQMIDYAEAHPGAKLVAYQDRKTMMEIFFAFTMDRFLDRETGECKFDGPEFQRMLSFLASVNAEYDWDNGDSRSEPLQIADGDVLLAQEYMYDALDIQVVNAYFEGGVNFIGYPTLDGTPSALLRAQGGVAMLSNSKSKEGAWKFLEYYHTHQEGYEYGINPDLSKLEASLDEKIRTKEGENSGVGYGDWEYDYHALTREEADIFLDVIKTARPSQNVDETILSIIEEEAGPFFAGQKSVEDVTKTIQSRVSLYVMENR